MTKFLSNLPIEKDNMPQHIAIIMDGNRRWAKSKNLKPTDGHRAGANNLEKIIEHAALLGVGHVTVYALSTENWKKRTLDEVRGIFGLLIEFAKTKSEIFRKSGIRFSILGDYTVFPFHVKNALKRMLNLVLPEQRLVFNVALNYGGRDEIVNAIKNIVKDKVHVKDIDEKLVSKYMYTKDQPDPELIIRPGGEIRLSNFLLWQSSYAELYFTDTLWPDFGPIELEKAIYWYQQRNRKLGK